MMCDVTLYSCIVQHLLLFSHIEQGCFFHGNILADIGFMRLLLTHYSARPANNSSWLAEMRAIPAV